MPVIVEPYNPEWPLEFAQIKTELEGFLSGVEYLSIEHVGSTSVLGLAAKPIIDIDVVATREQLQPVISALQHGGLLYMGELGIRDRHAFRRPLQSLSTNLYVCIQDSPALRNHLAIRDLLRRDAELRREYGDLRLSLGAAGMEIHEYMAKKSAVVVKLLELSGGVSKEELEAIVKANTSAKRVRPVKTERLMIRVFIIIDVKELHEVESSCTLEQVHQVVVRIIQNGGKAPREHIELAVLLHQPPYEANHKLIGRVGARITLPPTLDPKPGFDATPSLHSSEEVSFSLHCMFSTALHQQDFAKEAMKGFIPLLLQFVKRKQVGIKLEIRCDLDDTESCKLAGDLGFKKVKGTDEVEGEVYEKDLCL